MSASLLGIDIYERTRGVEADILYPAVPTQRFEIPQGGAHLRISKGHGVSRHP